jgi:predicted DNA-binding transcriptional regulator YafY
MKTSRVSRIIQILIALQSGQGYAVSNLATMLGVSRRMVFRDLQDLQKAGVPFHYDDKAGRYIIDPNFFLRPLDLTIQETLGLLLLAHKARNHIHFPFMDSALQAVFKIENFLPPKVKLFCNRVLMSVSVRAAPRLRTGSLDKIFVQLIGAILKKRVVNVHYYLPNQRECLVFDLSPYHLFYSEHMWYVVGRSHIDKRLRTFKLNWINKLTVLDKRFVEDKKFDFSEHLAKAWSMVPEGRLYHVKLKFLPEIAHNVAEIQWHSTQTVTLENDGSAIVEFRVDGLNEITWWVLSYGDKVQVLAPRILQQKIIEIAQNIVRQNEQLFADGNKFSFEETPSFY